MKPNIHPKYAMSTVSCACGNTFITRSTKPVIKLDICSGCHPLFTGKQKMLDTAGRVERFQKRFSATQGKMLARKPKTAKEAKTAAKAKSFSTTPRKTAAQSAKEARAKKPAKSAEEKKS